MVFVLDLDDTLYLERDYVLSGFLAVDRWLLAQRRIEGFFDKARRSFQRGIRREVFNAVLAQYDIEDQSLVDELVKVYRTHHPKIQLLRDAETFLATGKMVDFAMITDGYPEAQWGKIEALGIAKYVSKIVVTGDWGQEFWKPHHRGFLTVQGNRPSSECVYIADNPAKDFIAPKELGWGTSVRVRRKNALHYDLPTPSHCIEINSFDEIAGVFGG